MRVPVIEKVYGYYLIPTKINKIQPHNISHYSTTHHFIDSKGKQNKKNEEVTLYWYTRKDLRGKLNHGYIDI